MAFTTTLRALLLVTSVNLIEPHAESPMTAKNKMIASNFITTSMNVEILLILTEHRFKVEFSPNVQSADVSGSGNMRTFPELDSYLNDDTPFYRLEDIAQLLAQRLDSPRWIVGPLLWMLIQVGILAKLQ